MRRTIVLAMIGAGIMMMAASAPGRAQTTTGATSYAVKFVCGTQSPLAGVTPPSEPAVKPGNYATKINVEAFSANTLITYRVSLANGSAASSPVTLTLGSLQTRDITCSDIAKALPSTVAIPAFINGFVDLTGAPSGTATTIHPISVTAVYTSQGCSFEDERPVCGGPTSIEVVPEQPLTFLLSLAT